MSKLTQTTLRKKAYHCSFAYNPNLNIASVFVDGKPALQVDKETSEIFRYNHPMSQELLFTDITGGDINKLLKILYFLDSYIGESKISINTLRQHIFFAFQRIEVMVRYEGGMAYPEAVETFTEESLSNWVTVSIQSLDSKRSASVYKTLEGIPVVQTNKATKNLICFLRSPSLFQKQIKYPQLAFRLAQLKEWDLVNTQFCKIRRYARFSLQLWQLHQHIHPEPNIQFESPA